MDLFEEFFVNDQAQNGKWFDFKNGARVKIRSVKSDHYDKTIIIRRNKAGNPLDLTEGDIQKITNEAIADSLIVDWENIKDKKKQLKCDEKTKRNAISKYKIFKEKILVFAGDLSNFQDKELDT